MMTYRNQMYLRIRRSGTGTIKRFQEHSVATLLSAAGGEYLVSIGLNCIGFDSSAGSVAGFAVTAHNGAADNLAMHAATSLTESGDILVITSDDGGSAALWGDLMTELALARGVTAVIVEGAIRDLSGIRQLGLPTFYRSVNPRTATKARAEGINVPVSLPLGTVYPGDIVVVDEDGVMSVPQDSAEAILASALEIDKNESELRKQLRLGKTYFAIADLHHKLKEGGVQTLDRFCSRSPSPSSSESDT